MLVKVERTIVNPSDIATITSPMYRASSGNTTGGVGSEGAGVVVATGCGPCVNLFGAKVAVRCPGGLWAQVCAQLPPCVCVCVCGCVCA